MEEMINKFDAMFNLVNKYLYETWGMGLYDHEFRDVIEILRGPGISKIAAIKYVREATKRTESETFKLDLTNHEGTPISHFTGWAATNNIDLATGEVKVEYIGLREAKDLVEFIQLNLDKIAG